MNACTVVFFPKQINIPAVKIDDFLSQSAGNIITIFANTPSPTVPSLEAGDETNKALLKLKINFDFIGGSNKKYPYNTKKQSKPHNKNGSTTNRISASGVTINN